MNLQNSGIKNGLIFGILAVTAGILIYLINKETFLNPSLRMVLSLAFPIFFARHTILQERAIRGGILNFTDAVRTGFTCMAIGITIYAVFQNLMLAFDFELLEMQRDTAVEAATKLMEMMNAPKSTIAEYEELTAESLRPTIRSFALGLARNYFFGFIIVVISAAILKRDQ